MSCLIFNNCYIFLLNILKLYSLVRTEIHQGTVQHRTQLPSEFDVLSADNIFLRILSSDKILHNASVNTKVKAMFAFNLFVLFGFFQDELEVITKELKLSYEAGWDVELYFSSDGILKSSLEIYFLFDDQFNVVSIEKELVRIMETEVDSIKCKYVIDLLIVHLLICFKSIYQFYVFH